MATIVTGRIAAQKSKRLIAKNRNQKTIRYKEAAKNNKNEERAIKFGFPFKFMLVRKVCSNLRILH